VKSALVVLPVFAAIFAALFSVLTISSTLYQWVESAQAVESAGFGVLMPAVIDSLGPALTVSTVLALFLLLFAVRRRRRIGAAVMLLSSLCAILCYGGLFLLIQGIEAGEERSAVLSPYPAGTIHHLDHSLFYAAELRHEPSTSRPRFGTVALITPHTRVSPQQEQAHTALELYREGLIDPSAGDFIVRNRVFPEKEGERTVQMADNGGVLPGTTASPLIAAVSREARMAFRALEHVHRRSIILLAAAVAAQVFFVVASWAFVRTSSWPLLNAVLALLLLRGFFALHRLTDAELVMSIFSGIGAEKYIPLFPTAVLIAVALLFSLWNLAFSLGRGESG
jgi:hypothetical protein